MQAFRPPSPPAHLNQGVGPRDRHQLGAAAAVQLALRTTAAVSGQDHGAIDVGCLPCAQGNVGGEDDGGAGRAAVAQICDVHRLEQGAGIGDLHCLHHPGVAASRGGRQRVEARRGRGGGWRRGRRPCQDGHACADGDSRQRGWAAAAGGAAGGAAAGAGGASWAAAGGWAARWAAGGLAAAAGAGGRAGAGTQARKQAGYTCAHQSITAGGM